MVRDILKAFEDHLKQLKRAGSTLSENYPPKLQNTNERKKSVELQEESFLEAIQETECNQTDIDFEHPDIDFTDDEDENRPGNSVSNLLQEMQAKRRVLIWYVGFVGQLRGVWEMRFWQAAAWSYNDMRVRLITWRS